MDRKQMKLEKSKFWNYLAGKLLLSTPHKAVNPNPLFVCYVPVTYIVASLDKQTNKNNNIISICAQYQDYG
jgi:hypothetical protein